MYASYVPSLSFLAQTEAKLQNCPPLGWGGSDPPEGGGVGVGVNRHWGDPLSGGQLFSSHSSHMPSFRILVQTEAEIVIIVLLYYTTVLK